MPYIRGEGDALYGERGRGVPYMGGEGGSTLYKGRGREMPYMKGEGLPLVQCPHAHKAIRCLLNCIPHHAGDCVLMTSSVAWREYPVPF